MSVDPGFRAEHVLTFEINLPADHIQEARRELYTRVVERLQGLPGVTAAGAINELPFNGGTWVSGWMREGRPKPKLEELVSTDARIVTPQYFAAMGIALHRGRLLIPADVRQSLRVAVIDDALARALWPGEDPLGKRIRGWRAKSADDPRYPWLTVVGIVGGVHYDGLDVPPRAQLYMPMAQGDVWPGMACVVRTTGDPAALVAATRAAVREVDRNQPIAAVRTLDQTLASSVAPRRFLLQLLGLFASLALVLAAVGVYGVTYVSVVERTRELGLRIALGARPGQVLSLLFARAAVLLAAGLALGLAAAFALTRAMASLLYAVSPADPATYAAGALLLTAAALLSVWIPGRRASRLDPMTALRQE